LEYVALVTDPLTDPVTVACCSESKEQTNDLGDLGREAFDEVEATELVETTLQLNQQQEEEQNVGGRMHPPHRWEAIAGNHGNP